MFMGACMNVRPKPCPECPWVKATAAGQFSRERFEALRGTTGEPGNEAPLGAGLFACHKSAEGKEIPCAGWLAAVGIESLSVRLLISTGSLPAEVLHPGEDWPELHESYDEMAEAKTA
jgi:hypothetical protein